MFGDINAIFPSLTQLKTVDLTNNRMIGLIDATRTARTQLQTLLLDGNALDREQDHTARLLPEIMSRWNTRATASALHQDDITAPELVVHTVPLSPVPAQLSVKFSRAE